MKIAVTGGCGFIGSHTTELLISKGYDVVVFDNLSTGSIENLIPGAIFYEGDIADRTQVDAFYTREKPDMVMHMAAQVDVQTSMKNPSFDAAVNIMGTMNLLDLGKKHGLKRFVYSSSAAVYGNPEYLGLDENHPTNPESFYGYSKLVPEKYISMMMDSYAVIRYANVYGPRQKAEGEGGVVAIFTENMKNGEDCVIFGDGNQTRDFVFVKDIARANLLALESSINFTANASTAESTSVNDLFNAMKDIYGYSKPPVYMDARKGDVIHSWLANSMIKELLGWGPEYNLKAGISEMSGT